MFDDNKFNSNFNPDEMKPNGDFTSPEAQAKPSNSEQEWVTLEPEQDSYSPEATPVSTPPADGTIPVGGPRISVEQSQYREAHRPDLSASQELPKYKQPGYFQRPQQAQPGQPEFEGGNYQAGQPHPAQQAPPQGQAYYGQQGQNYQNAQAGQQGPVNRYGYQPNYEQFAQRNTEPSTTAYVGMSLGIASLVIAFVPKIGLLSPILAVIGLVISIMENKKQKSGVAIAGIVCSSIALALSILIIIACASCLACAFNDLRYIH
ncbi:MAG: hypothetical protein Q4P65_03850 [Eubacteriales bacterium]|nr:hypothetical protein [Eubacteriales bacterium]